MLVANETFEKSTDLDNQNEYECCTFVDCDLSSANLSATKFIECVFEGCNLSNMLVNETSFLDVEFNNCKILGVQFDTANRLLFSAQFSGCQLDHSTFFQMTLKQTNFLDSKLIEVDFTEADLSGSTLRECDLTNTKFDRTNLEKADLRTSFGFIIDPEINKVAKAQVSLLQLPGLLARYNLKIENDQ